MGIITAFASQISALIATEFGSIFSRSSFVCFRYYALFTAQCYIVSFIEGNVTRLLKSVIANGPPLYAFHPVLVFLLYHSFLFDIN